MRVEFREHRRIVGRIDHDRDGIVVLGGGAHHGWSADVDVLDGLSVAAGGACHGLGEGIEVHDQEVDAFDAMQRHDAFIDTAPAEQPAVDTRVQGLDASVHDLGETGVLRDFGDRDAVLGEQARRTTRGEDGDATAFEFAGEIQKTGLVGDGQQCAAQQDRHGGGVGSVGGGGISLRRDRGRAACGAAWRG